MPRELLRLVVPSPDRRRLLARPNGLAGWILPVVPVTDRTAWTVEADAAAHRSLGAATAPVRRLDVRTWELEARGRIPAVGTAWIAPEEAGRLGADADAPGLWRAAEDAGPPSPHLGPGWRDDVEAWLGALPEDVRADGITVVRHWELGAVLAVPSGGGTLVVKEPGAGFTREAGVVEVLQGLAGAPTLVAADGPRFATRWAGPTTTAPASVVAGTLGRLQRGAAGRLGELRSAGCAHVTALTSGLDPAVDRAIEEVDALGLAESVVHGDAHGDNFVGDGEVVLVDWSDATIGCPAIDLDLLLGHGGRGDRDDRDDRVVVEAWSAGFGCAAAPVVAALPAIRVVAAALGVVLHRERRPALPPAVLPIWDAWARHWETRLRELLS